MKYLVLPLLAFAIYISYGCSCTGVSPINRAVNRADAVFHGRVIEVTRANMAEMMDSSALNNILELEKSSSLRDNLFAPDQAIKAKIQIISSYKGNTEAGDVVSVYTAPSGASCGYMGFRKNKEVVVYSYKKRPSYFSFFIPRQYLNDNVIKSDAHWTNMCTRTTGHDIYREIWGLERLNKQ